MATAQKYGCEDIIRHSTKCTKNFEINLQLRVCCPYGCLQALYIYSFKYLFSKHCYASLKQLLLVLNKISNTVKANVSFNQFEYYAVSISHTCNEATENTTQDNVRKARSYNHCCRGNAISIIYCVCLQP